MRNLEYFTLGNTLVCADHDSDLTYVLDVANRRWVKIADVPGKIEAQPMPVSEYSNKDENHTKTEQIEISAKPKGREKIDYSDGFERFWGMYKSNCVMTMDSAGNTVNAGTKARAAEAWNKLSGEEQATALSCLEIFFHNGQPGAADQYLKHKQWSSVPGMKPKVKDGIELARAYVDANGLAETCVRFNITAESNDEAVGIMVTDPDIMEMLREG